MKTLGILGGVGPETTSEVYLSLVSLVRNSGETIYPPIVIYNMPFPYVIEEEAIVQGKNAEKMLPYLTQGAQILEKAGAEIGILPCNTLHAYIEQIRESVGFPFLSILEEVVSVLKEKNVKNVALLATETTIRTKIYEDALSENDINIHYPTPEEQATINRVIIELLNGVKKSSHSQDINVICDALRNRGAENILLACTDLQLAIKETKQFDSIIDTTDILIQATVRELLRI